MAFVGLKLDLDLEIRAAHLHQKFQGVPPRGGGGGLKRAVNPHNANIAVEHLCVGRHHLHLFETYALRSIHFGVFQGAKHLLKR